jgi:acetyl esterase/lipase
MPADEPPLVTVSRRAALMGLAGLASACSRLAFLAANVPALFGAYSRRIDLPYGTDPRQKVDVYLPEPAAGAARAGGAGGAGGAAAGAGVAAGAAHPQAPRPMIVFWNGGRWSFGDKKDYRFVGAALAGLGYVAVVANYRDYPQVKMPGFMDDAARAAQWAFAHAAEFNADPERFYVMGHSAGAHMAALVSLDERYFAALGAPVPRIAGVIGLSGPYDFLPLEEADLQDMFGPPALYPQSQPINYVRPDAPPFLLVVGLEDHVVLPKNTLNLAAALKAVDVPVSLEVYPKLSHADTVAALSLPARGRAPVLLDIRQFVGAARGSPAV